MKPGLEQGRTPNPEIVEPRRTKTQMLETAEHAEYTETEGNLCRIGRIPHISRLLLCGGCCVIPIIRTSTSSAFFRPSVLRPSALTPSPQLIHQFENAFTNFKQLFAGFDNHCLRQQVPGRDGLQRGL